MQLLDEFERWVIPKFPVSGSMLMKHVSMKKMIGSVLNELKRIWIDTDFELTSEQLMEHVPSIVTELEEKYQTLDKEYRNKKLKKMK